ncbi:MAG: bacteriocin [Firmicutes bacterium]|nr:bacteriocin [Candidatus Colimorpha enterica]
MTYTKEQIKKAKEAKSAGELLALAKENGIEMTAEKADKYYAGLRKSAELSEDELNNVSGGCGDDEPQNVPLLNLHLIPVGTIISSVSSRKDPCPVCGARLDCDGTGLYCMADPNFVLHWKGPGAGHGSYYCVAKNDISQ